jgi:hypothetical protein
MMFGRSICFLILVLQVNSLKEFLLEGSYLLKLACSNTDFVWKLRGASKFEICDQIMARYENMNCIKLDEEGGMDTYTLELYMPESEFIGKYSCKPNDGVNAKTMPILFSIYDASHFRIDISRSSNLIELLSIRNSNLLPRKLQTSCSATITFNTVTYI